MIGFIESPFAQGLALGVGVGILIAAWISVSSWLKRRSLRIESTARLAAIREEMDRLRDHLRLQMEIQAKGNESQSKELAALREQNENLRVFVQLARQKPDRQQLRTLEIWQRALDQLHSDAPGFAPVWQSALRQAEAETTKAESGIGRLFRRFLPSPSTPPAPLPPEDPPSPSADPSQSG